MRQSRKGTCSNPTSREDLTSKKHMDGKTHSFLHRRPDQGREGLATTKSRRLASGRCIASPKPRPASADREVVRMEKLTLSEAATTAVSVGPVAVVSLLIATASDQITPPLSSALWWQICMGVFSATSLFGVIAFAYLPLHARGLRLRLPWYRIGGRSGPSEQPIAQRNLERALAVALSEKETAEKQRDDAFLRLNAPVDPPGGYYPYTESAPLADTGETAIHVTSDTREQTFSLRRGGFRTIHWSGLQLRVDHLGLMQRQSGNYGYASRIKAVLQTERGYQLRIAAAADVLRDQETSVFIMPPDENMISWATGDRSICHFSIQEEGGHKRSVAFTIRVTRINSLSSELRLEGYFDDWSA